MADRVDQQRLYEERLKRFRALVCIDGSDDSIAA